MKEGREHFDPGAPTRFLDAEGCQRRRDETSRASANSDDDRRQAGSASGGAGRRECPTHELSKTGGLADCQGSADGILRRSTPHGQCFNLNVTLRYANSYPVPRCQADTGHPFVCGPEIEGLEHFGLNLIGAHVALWHDDKRAFKHAFVVKVHLACAGLIFTRGPRARSLPGDRRGVGPARGAAAPSQEQTGEGIAGQEPEGEDPPAGGGGLGWQPSRAARRSGAGPAPATFDSR